MKLILAFTILVWVGFSQGSLTRPTTSAEKDEMIFIRGKWFNRNGKSNLPNQGTLPQNFYQCMDHFTANGCNETWRQRYWTRDDYFEAGGPIFIQFGGEGPADALIDNYYWHTYAAQHKALLVVLEHRFYGESYPTEDNTFESLQLLTSQQALADAANFIEQYSDNNNLTNAKWVAFGGSYAGNLAAWMKQKYPEHVTTAVSSSGPLEAVYDFPGYLGTVSQVVQDLDPSCYATVYDAFSCMESLVNGSSCGNYTHPSQILPTLHQCFLVDFNNRLDRELFFNFLAMGDWADNWPSALVLEKCAVLNDANGANELEVYGDFLVRVGNGECITSIQSLTDEVLRFIRSREGRQSGAAGWFWQTCYEFGYYMSSDPKMGLFGYDTFSGDPYGISCSEEYGTRFTRQYIESRIAETNDYYKGKDIDSKCVIFVNGGYDPWHSLGINDPSETTANNTVVFIPKAEHCDDMLNPTTEEMRTAQEKIMEQIGIYLNDPNC